MKYPILKINGKPIKYDKAKFRLFKKQISSSLTFDNQENQLGLTKKDIELLSWNSAVMCLEINK